MVYIMNSRRLETDVVAEGMSAASDDEVADWNYDCSTLKNDVRLDGPRWSNSHETLHRGKTIDRPASDSSLEETSVAGTEFDVELVAQAGHGECGFGDTTKSSTSAVK